MVYFILILGYSLNLIFISIFKYNYSYDEIIVTEISKQPISTLLNTIKAEPHPPGFYFLLKFLPVDNPTATKLIITSASFILSMGTIFFLHKKELINKFKLKHGLVLFFSSYTFLSISTEVKQTSLSAPILLLFLSTLFYTANKNKISPINLITINISALLLLSLGYINYLIGLFTLIAICLIKKNKLLIYSSIFQLIILLFFLKLFALDQIIINTHRFSWINEFYSNPINLLSTHISGFYSQHPALDIPLIFFLLLIFLGIYKNNTKTPKAFYYAQIVALILFLITIITKTSVRVRYSTPLLFTLSTLAGWGLIALNNAFKTNSLYKPTISLFFCLGFLGHIYNQTTIQKNNQIIVNAVNSFPENKKVALAIDREIYPLAFKLKFFKNKKNLIPVNFFNPGLIENSQTITQKHLTNYSPPRLPLKIKYENYLFVDIQRPIKSNSEKDKINLILTLNKSCKQSNIININNSFTLYSFEDCLSK